MNKTLIENEVEDESEEFYKLGMNDEQFLPPIHLYFNDDLTEAWMIKRGVNISKLQNDTIS